MSNKFDEKRKIELDDLTPDNLQELYDAKSEIQISDLVICENCNNIYPRDAVQMDSRIIEVPHDNWDYIRGEYYETSTREEEDYFYCPDCGYGEDEEEEFDTYDFTNSDLFDFDFDIERLDGYITDEFKDAYKKFMNNKMEESKMIESKSEKMTLEEATIRSLYNQLDDSEKKKSVDGIVDDILVITDPEISSDEYDELIDRANEIVEETEIEVEVEEVVEQPQYKSISEVTISKTLLKEIDYTLSSIISQNKKSKDYKREITPFIHEHVPKISLFDYLCRIQKYSEVENSTIIISLIYLDRICNKKGIKLTKYNIHRLLFTSILVAIKYNEDIIYDTKFYSKVAGVSVEELKILESAFLKIIDFQLFVSEELYNKYYNYLFREMKS